MKKAHASLLALALLLLAAPAAALPPVTLSVVDPASPAPGTPAGWGFTLTNNTANYLVVTSVSASGTLAALGTFTDFAAQFQFVVVAPSSFVTQTFDNVTQTGAGSLLSNLLNASASGTITMTYDAYSSDPAGGGFDPAASGVSWGNSVSAGASFGTTPVILQRFEAR